MFLRKYLEDKVDSPLIDVLANIVVIGPATNIKISAKDPMNYISKYKITSEKLAQQFISDEITSIGADKYHEWVKNRAQVLADQANVYLDALKLG